MNKYICIHGHFYQPPRENPWLEEVELQDSAAPYHDWNERITAECYAPNTASRLLDGEKRVVDIINNFSRISFNVGPTLFSWMERNKPGVSEAILAADKVSRELFSGHGSAIAQVYNHMIMPLANRRDKYTQAYWGIVDFEKRFGRYPEGMWLPETAVDVETLEVLAELHIRFTVLAPRQAKRVKQMGKGARWHDVKHGIDTTVPYLCQLPSGKSIALFFYDGTISQDIAFGGLLQNGQAFADRLRGAFRKEDGQPQLVHIATDGETYGHHHKYGDMALSYCLHSIDSAPEVSLTNYAEFLSLYPPTQMVEIWDNSSWSCVHGVERWRENCGCNSGREGWTQAWRKPLRESFDLLRDTLAPVYEQEATTFLADPWRARNDYIEVVENRSHENVQRFLALHATRELSHDESVRTLKLLEMQRNTMLMYTSCGWFFDEISGIETTQVLRYASEVIQTAEELLGLHLEKGLLDTLATAPSNVLENGAKAYDLYARTNRVDLLRVGAHYAIASLFSEHKPRTSLYCYTVETESFKLTEAGKFRLTIGRVRVSSDQTWDSDVISFAALHLGDQNISGGVRSYTGEDAFTAMQNEILREFEHGRMTVVLQLMGKHFGDNTYSIWHLFRDEQRRVLNEILNETLEHVRRSLRTIYEENSSFISLLQTLAHPVPAPLMDAATDVVNEDLMSVFDREALNVVELDNLIRQVAKWSLPLDEEELKYRITSWVNTRLERQVQQPADMAALDHTVRVLELVAPLRLDLDLWKAQNAYFTISKNISHNQREKSEAGDSSAGQWLKAFARLGELLSIKVAL